jgi:DNA-binding response OmpR family regulator
MVNPARELRVLLVEDDVLIARTVVRLLGQHGAHVTVAISAEEIMALAGQFDLGIFDLDLPAVSGVEMARLCAVRGLVAHTVFFSGTYDHDHVEAARDLGEFIEKGAGISTLLRYVIDLRERTSGVFDTVSPATPKKP